MKSIPASKLVAVQPGVLGTGGNPLALNSVWGTQSTRVPLNTVYAAFGLQAVKDFFGDSSDEARMANVYFTGFKNCTRLPQVLYFAQYNEAAVSAYLRSGSFDGVALSVIQALSGTVIVPIDGRTVTSANINLSSATSPANAATLIQTGLQTAGGIFSGTATLSGTTMTVATTVSGQLHIGDSVSGTGITPGTTVLSFGTYTPTGGTGTVTMSAAMTTEASPVAVTVTSAATVTFDSQLQEFVIHSATTGATSTVGFATGSISTGLKLTSATGAVLSQGGAATTPSAFGNMVVSQTQNWATLTTVFEPTLSEKGAFATWVSGASPAGAERFAYVGEDTDITVTAGPAPNSFAGQTASFNGRVAVYSDPSVVSYGEVAAFVCGATASINWSAPGGRITFAYKGNALLVPSVTDLGVSDNLDENGYNYYGAFATANDSFQLFQNGQISGDWDWIDEYVNQIYLNSQFQLALVAYLANVNSVPYNQIGYGGIRGVMITPTKEAVNNGTINAGVALSGAQVQALIAATGGIDISSTLFQQGWYLQILDPGAQVRQNRGSPDMTFWYTSGGSIQNINLASIDIL